jgi:hypothetical protein
MSEEEKLNHTQIIVAHTDLLAKLNERSENQSKQILALFDLLNRMDVKIDTIQTDLTRLKTERNVCAWIFGAVAGLIASMAARWMDK